MVYYVRLKYISLNCFDILTQEMILSRNDSSLFRIMSVPSMNLVGHMFTIIAIQVAQKRAR